MVRAGSNLKIIPKAILKKLVICSITGILLVGRTLIMRLHGILIVVTACRLLASLPDYAWGLLTSKDGSIRHSSWQGLTVGAYKGSPFNETGTNGFL